MPVRLPLIIVGVLLAVIVPIGFLTDDGPTPAAQTRASAPVATIARRVQELRGLRFERLPKPVRITAADARRAGLEDLDRSYAPPRRRADEAMLTLLGLLPPGTDLRDINGTIFGEQVAGYYDPRSKDLRIVEGAGTSNRVLDEMVIAHELTHALDDQAIGIDQHLGEGSGDRSMAYLALVEGVATEVMYDYLNRHFDEETAFGGLLGGAFAGTGDLPPFVVAGLTFPYVSGQQFVATLLRRAGRRWTLVDLAERLRPPASTEQVLHPQKWIEVEGPDRVRLPGLGAELGADYERLAAGVFGEFQTGQLLALAGRPQAQAAAGWGGDRYELWRQDASAPCRTPCTGRDVLVMRWTWDTPRDASEFEAALRDTLADGLEAHPAGPDRWTLRGGAVALRTGRSGITLAFAPDARTARQVAD